MKIGISKSNGYFTSRETYTTDTYGYIDPKSDAIYMQNNLPIYAIGGSHPVGTQVKIFGMGIYSVGFTGSPGNIQGNWTGITATQSVPIVLTVDDNNVWWQVSNYGTIGFTGPIGNTGFTGPQGFTGPTGPDGVAGPIGTTGIPGGEGGVGPIGDTGDIGTAGSAGNPGNPGGEGFTGPQGNEGNQGPPGTPC
jgi:hypothetical protein